MLLDQQFKWDMEANRIKILESFMNFLWSH